VTGSCEHGNESSGFIKGGKFLDRLRSHKLSKDSSMDLHYSKENYMVEDIWKLRMDLPFCKRRGTSIRGSSR